MSNPEELPARDMFGARPGEYVMPHPVYRAKCKSCGAEITFVRTAGGRMMPLSLSTVEERDGVRYALSHFIDCPDSKEWSGKP
jgi:hypothetical protein